MGRRLGCLTEGMSAGESEFECVRAEWTDIVARGHSEVAIWRSHVARLAQEEACLRAQGRWVGGRDDLFGVLGIQRQEIRHTAMIGWLLDPCMRHGFGADAYRAQLVEAVEKCWADYSGPITTALASPPT